MPRYEFSEGASNKFWEITLKGTSFVTRYGKIGTDGQETLKEFDSPDKAKKEYEKLIAEKEKKGYELVSGGGGTRKAAATPAKKAAAADLFGNEGDDEDEAPRAKAKPAPKAAPARPAAKAAAGAGGSARRFELVEGSSNKFWEIQLEGSSFTTRYGKIGTDGQVTLKEFDSPDKAQKEYDKLVAEKTKKGYVEV